MGEYRSKEWQGSATSVRDRMDHLYNNTDMADLHLLAVDEQWWWGQTVKDFTAHRLVLCAASPILHQLFYPVEGGLDIPQCITLTQNTNSGLAKLELDGIPPIAVEALLEYCYKDRFDRKDYENGYSRNLLWRLWYTAKILRVQHLFQLCTETLEETMCDETVFWDLNYSLVYQSFGTENIRKRVTNKIESLGNNLYEHPNLVWLDTSAIREILKTRGVGSSEPVTILNNILRWALYQLDRSLCEEVNGCKDTDIPVSHRVRFVQQIRQGNVKEYSAEDINKYLSRVIDLVPFEEMSQKDFLHYVMETGLLDQASTLKFCKEVMKSVVDNPDRLCKSVHMMETDPTNTVSALTKALSLSPRSPSLLLRNQQLDLACSTVNKPSEHPSNPSQEINNNSGENKPKSPLRSRPSIQSSLEQARLRRLNQEKRLSSSACDGSTQQSGVDGVLVDASQV